MLHQLLCCDKRLGAVSDSNTLELFAHALRMAEPVVTCYFVLLMAELLAGVLLLDKTKMTTPPLWKAGLIGINQNCVGLPLVS